MKRTVEYQCDNTIDVFNNSPTTHMVDCTIKMMYIESNCDTYTVLTLKIIIMWK